MAEGFFKSILAGNEVLKDYTVSSAGIYAYEGDNASSNSIKIMNKEWNIDISKHTATILTGQAVDDAFLILTMTKQQKEEILSIHPTAANKLFTLKEFANGRQTTRELQDYDYTLDIIDPFGLPEHFYSICAKEIKDSVEKLTILLEDN